MTFAAEPHTPRADDVRLARAVGLVLRGGVIIAGALVALGVALFLGGDHTGSPRTLDEATGKSGAEFHISVHRIWSGLGDGSPMAFIEVGLLVLLLTPTVRVAITAWFLAAHRERVLAWMAIFVLGLLLLGFIGVGA